MRVACVGGGPAGLFLALLLCRAGDHQVDVYERSPAGATYGFGVVFSRLSLARLRRTAPDVVATLLADGALWDDVEVRHAGEVIRSGGHGFAAVERRALLGTLARFAKEAGAVLHFGVEADHEELLRHYDVVAAADGAGSRSRAALAERLGERVTWGGSRYAWFGVDRAFDAMTFLFADGGHGVAGAHVYPYAKDRSTFLVEIAEETWRSAGLADGQGRPPGWTDGQAMDYCGNVFADDLNGARLLGNGSRWLRFPQVTAERWSDGRLVIIGDAAHTAHFSVGSGTTMALEDAAELADCLAGEPDVETALARFEAARRPVVRGIQRAAWASLRMWEQPQDYSGLDAAALMLQLLTRTGQSPVDLLLRVDPGLPARLGRQLTALPDGLVPELVEPGGTVRPAEHAVLLREDAWRDGVPRVAEAAEAGCPVVVELDPGDPVAGADLVAQRLGRLRRDWPEAVLGLAVRSPAAAEDVVGPIAERVRGLARSVRVDMVAVAPGTAAAAENRTAQMALCERIRAGAGVRTVYVCGPGELNQGWTHVQAGRADSVWSEK